MSPLQRLARVSRTTVASAVRVDVAFVWLRLRFLGKWLEGVIRTSTGGVGYRIMWW